MSIKAMFAYNQSSEGADALKEALGIPKIRHTGSKFVPSSTKTLLNWGATTDRFPANLRACQIINPPERVDNAVDKMRTFNLFREAGVSTPEFTTSKADATQWLEGGTMVFARTQLRAHSGRGIAIMDPDHPDTWEVAAPLYVKYIPKKDEYRVHIFRGQVIDTQRKALRADLKGSEGINFKVRNLANGFIFARNEDRIVPAAVISVAIASVAALNLDFGAVDVIYNARNSQAYSLEVNTAPGLVGTTVQSYATAFSGI
jgi:glutathione synthase/RimK-type ligase-like ATP-grasp enzyme